MISKWKLSGVVSLVLAVVFLSATCLQAKTTYLGLDKKRKLKVNGRYLVEVYKDHKWQRAGALGFNQFYSDKEINLGQFMTGGVDSKIRIIQEGGGAAHLDSVFLGGKSPVKAFGREGENVLKKLSSKDFDVIDAHKKTFVLTFPAANKSKTLTLTARIEGTVISKTPFQFPVHNLYQRMNEGSRFYEYKLGAKRTEKPFFNEWSPSGSGHPSAYTYGYVKDDGKHLLATIDFTGDNTKDGDKDYAKVYVKTDMGLKEFKVSENETKWGRPSFTYTDKVAYQHKVYDFKIPFSELGMTEDKKIKELQLAFAAFGTNSAIGRIIPDVAFATHNGRYLMVFVHHDGS